MRSSCIQHPAREPLIIIRQWQVEFCEGDRIAAALLSFFEYWHNNKLDHSPKARQANNIAETHGDARTQDESLLQFHSEKELHQGILGLASGPTIRKSLAMLKDKGVITVSRNPNPRYHFDRTNFFLFHPEVPQAFLDKRKVPDALVDTKNLLNASNENSSRYEESSSRRAKSFEAIPETSSEITTETSEERLSDVHFSKTGNGNNSLKSRPEEIKQENKIPQSNAVLATDVLLMETQPERLLRGDYGHKEQQYLFKMARLEHLTQDSVWRKPWERELLALGEELKAMQEKINGLARISGEPPVELHSVLGKGHSDGDSLSY